MRRTRCSDKVAGSRDTAASRTVVSGVAAAAPANALFFGVSSCNRLYWITRSRQKEKVLSHSLDPTTLLGHGLAVHPNGFNLLVRDRVNNLLTLRDGTDALAIAATSMLDSDNRLHRVGAYSSLDWSMVPEGTITFDRNDPRHPDLQLLQTWQSSTCPVFRQERSLRHIQKF